MTKQKAVHHPHEEYSPPKEKTNSLDNIATIIKFGVLGLAVIILTSMIWYAYEHPRVDPCGDIHRDHTQMLYQCDFDWACGQMTGNEANYTFQNGASYCIDHGYAIQVIVANKQFVRVKKDG